MRILANERTKNVAPVRAFNALASDFLTGPYFPLAGAGRLEDGVADVLGFEGVPEVGGGGFTGLEAFDEIGNLMDEGVFVTNLETRDPPVFQ